MRVLKTQAKIYNLKMSKYHQYYIKLHTAFILRLLSFPVNKVAFSNRKDPNDRHNSWGIYKNYCECGLSYIGQTKHAFGFRLREQENYIRNFVHELDKYIIAKHS